MSDIDISRLSTNNLVTLDSTGLASTPFVGVSSSFLALSDDGYYGDAQILELSMFGLTPEQMNHGRLYASVKLSNGTFTISHRPDGDPNQEIICQNDIGSAGGVYDIDLTPYGAAYANLKGTVKLAVGSEDLEIQLLVPQSTSQAMIEGSTSWFLSALELNGVTKDNSDNGLLAWSLNAAAGNYTFTLTNPGVGTVATASGSIYEYAPFVCDLVPSGGSGITGTVILEGFGYSTGLAIVKVFETLRLPNVRVDSSLTSASLSVSGEGQITGNTGIGGAPSGDNQRRLRVYGGSDNHSGVAIGDNGSDIGTVGFLASDGSKRGMIQLNDANGSIGDRLGLYAFSYGYLNEVLSIRGGGAVGVNRLSPTFTLDVNGTLGVSGAATFNGVPRFNSGNATGSGAASLGSNSPASTLSAPYTWLPITTSDGSTGYIPVWK